MGLDMYLTGRMYVGEWSTPPENYAAVKSVFPQIPWKVNGVSFDAGYWRKANHIHQWFVDNVQDGIDECREHAVSREQLTELLSVCKRVMADPKLAEELLSTVSGFFFGSTDYDEYYFEDIERTIAILEEILAPENEKKYLYVDFYYQSSW
jgi:hypothetical protein